MDTELRELRALNEEFLVDSFTVLERATFRPPGTTQTVITWEPEDPARVIACRVSSPLPARSEAPAAGSVVTFVERVVVFPAGTELSAEVRGRIHFTETGEEIMVELLEPAVAQSFEVRRAVRVRVIEP